MDMHETLWSHAVWINFLKREESSWSNVEYFVHNFKSLLQFDDHETDMLYEQFIDYQMVETNEFPSTALNDAILLEHQDGTVEYRIDTIWYHLKQMRSPVGNNLRFNLLFKVAQIILLIPPSNACSERVFSLVNKNKNESSDRNRMGQDGSLSAILAVKRDCPEAKTKCFDYKPDKTLLDKARKATVTYNEKHKSSKC